MPQLDPYIFLSQFFWFSVFFFILYYWVHKQGLSHLYEFCWVQSRIYFGLFIEKEKKPESVVLTQKKGFFKKEYELVRSRSGSDLETRFYKFRK